MLDAGRLRVLYLLRYSASSIWEDIMNIAVAKQKLGKASKAFLAKKHRMLIDGKWVEAQSGKTFEVEDPATQADLQQWRPLFAP